MRERLLEAAKRAAQARGYGGLNFRELAQDVGIKHASIYHHFPSKADLGAAVARRYWEDTEASLDAISEQGSDPLECLQRYPDTFRKALEAENRICLCSFMAAEVSQLPDAVRSEIWTFEDINIGWLSRALTGLGTVEPEQVDRRARAIFAAVAGAQLAARSRADIAVYDALIESYRAVGLLPTS